MLSVLEIPSCNLVFAEAQRRALRPFGVDYVELAPFVVTAGDSPNAGVVPAAYFTQFATFVQTASASITNFVSIDGWIHLKLDGRTGLAVLPDGTYTASTIDALIDAYSSFSEYYGFAQNKLRLLIDDEYQYTRSVGDALIDRGFQGQIVSWNRIRTVTPQPLYFPAVPVNKWQAVQNNPGQLLSTVDWYGISTPGDGVAAADYVNAASLCFRRLPKPSAAWLRNSNYTVGGVDLGDNLLAAALAARVDFVLWFNNGGDPVPVTQVDPFNLTQPIASRYVLNPAWAVSSDTPASTITRVLERWSVLRSVYTEPSASAVSTRQKSGGTYEPTPFMTNRDWGRQLIPTASSPAGALYDVVINSDEKRFTAQ